MIDLLVILLKTVPKRRADGGREAPIEAASMSSDHHRNWVERRVACSPFARLTLPSRDAAVAVPVAASAKVRSALGNTGAAGMARIFFVGIVMATVACTALAQARKPLPPGVVGVLHIDAGTDYVFLDRPTTVGGACKGWKAVSIQAPGPAGSGMTRIICWKELNGQLLTATEAKVSSEVVPMDLIR